MGERIVIERTDADELGQQFHVRFVAGNGKRTFWCENLKTRASAIKAIKRHAATFVGENVQVVAAPLLASGLALRVRLGVTGATFHSQRDIEITELDSRTRKV